MGPQRVSHFFSTSTAELILTSSSGSSLLSSLDFGTTSAHSNHGANGSFTARGGGEAKAAIDRSSVFRPPFDEPDLGRFGGLARGVGLYGDRQRSEGGRESRLLFPLSTELVSASFRERNDVASSEG